MMEIHTKTKTYEIKSAFYASKELKWEILNLCWYKPTKKIDFYIKNKIRIKKQNHNKI